jgi:molybdopterin molybdotransferase
VGGEPIDVAQARRLVLEACRPLPGEEVPVDQALGRTLAADVVAAANVPGTDTSAMDGIAALPSPAGSELQIVDEARAGHPAGRLPAKGEAIRISTGAVVPDGPFGVLQLELLEDRGETVVTAEGLSEGRNVRRAGEDLGAGQVALEAGRLLDPAALGVAVAAGKAGLECASRPAVAIVATGDELRPPGEPLEPGQLHDSNLATLSALAVSDGARLVGAGKAGDTLEATEAALAGALEGADLLVCSGGVSVGPHDHVKEALGRLGAEELFWRVALKPGKPTWFGTRGGTLVFGLPGNPVSAMVTWILFVRPAIDAMLGRTGREPGRARLGEALPRNPARDECVRIRLRDGLAYATGPQGSHVLSSMALADGLAVVPRGEGELEPGAEVEVVPVAAQAASM